MNSWMARHIAADDGAVEDVEGGEQGRGAVALVVMGHCPGPTRLHGQARLGAVERLDLALLIDGEDDGISGRITEPSAFHSTSTPSIPACQTVVPSPRSSTEPAAAREKLQSSATPIAATNCMGDFFIVNSNRSFETCSSARCYSAWGPDADRHDNSLILLTLAGSCFGAGLQQRA